MNWYSGSIVDAVAESKRSNRLFLVYIEGNDDMSNLMIQTYNDPTVIEKLSSLSVIAVKLAANSVPYMQFCAIYPVLVIPSSFFIAVNGSPIEIITGNLPALEFCNKLDNLAEAHRKIVEIKLGANVPMSTSVASDPLLSRPQTVAETSQPSTSHTPTTAESTLSLEQKVDRAKALVEAQKQSKAKEEQEKERKQEIERRNVGKALQEAEQKKHDNELQEWAKNRAKEKEEERLAREKVKNMIAQDRAERAAKFQMTKQLEETERQRLAQNRLQAEQAMRDAAMSSNEARLQFRLPDGSHRNHSFSASASLEDARRFVTQVMRPPFAHFSLCTTFPRRDFTEANYSESLRDLQLTPSAVLLVLPAQTVSTLGAGTGFLTALMWNLLAPIRVVWNFIRSLLPGRPQPPQPASEAQNRQQTEPRNSNQGNERPENSQRKEAAFAKREGNVFRINNQSDDDENNTWNGNSTQQM